MPAERRRPRAPVGPHSASYLPPRRRPGDLLRVGRTPPAGAHYGKGLPRARVLGRASVLGEDVWKEAFQCGCSGDPSNSVPGAVFCHELFRRPLLNYSVETGIEIKKEKSP